MNGARELSPDKRPPAELEPASERRRRWFDLFLLPLAAFAAATALAQLLGAANLGTAATFGQIAFAAALVWVLLRAG
ncbi:hypothetical protein JDY09_03275 [Thermoleophilum album]|jgi:hypothetical protein|uniref:hypothetical protein n=1 Tax=Thermoleophilum album TaxID=29539 RepID=UPI00237D18EF|nr:hypothetical protein [Thermoleophilum album]WDT94288.1 hypothetical protein JDY09_03275 [Thermoleophilum album]